MPRVLAVGDDEAVIGAPFYVMERVAGEVVTTRVPAALDTPPRAPADAARSSSTRSSRSTPSTGARCGLEGFSRDPERYLERQLRRFGGLWEHHRTRELRGDRARRRVACRSTLPALAARRRSCTATTASATRCCAPRAPARLAAIFDWEMATIGDPLADVGYLCALWVERDDPPLGMFELSA